MQRTRLHAADSFTVPEAEEPPGTAAPEQYQQQPCETLHDKTSDKNEQKTDHYPISI